LQFNFPTTSTTAVALTPWGDYTGWSRVVRGALVWAGQPDPAQTKAAVRGQADPAAAGWSTIDPHGGGLTAQAICDNILQGGPNLAELREALVTLAPKPDGRSLGTCLRSLRKRSFGGYAFDRVAGRAGVARWVVRRAQDLKAEVGRGP
jgi:hypothetical protein